MHLALTITFVSACTTPFGLSGPLAEHLISAACVLSSRPRHLASAPTSVMHVYPNGVNTMTVGTPLSCCNRSAARRASRSVLSGKGPDSVQPSMMGASNSFTTRTSNNGYSDAATSVGLKRGLALNTYGVFEADQVWIRWVLHQKNYLNYRRLNSSLLSAAKVNFATFLSCFMWEILAWFLP